MWITQTYLGNPDPEALVHAYYFFEDYNSDQKCVTESIQTALASLGAMHQSNLSLLMPNRDYSDRIGAELRNKLGKFWWTFQGKLPGIFISNTPLSQIDFAEGEYNFYSFSGQNPETAAKTIILVREVINKSLEYEFQKKHEDLPKKSIWDTIISNIEFKPGIGPLKFDVKTAFLKRKRG